MNTANVIEMWDSPPAAASSPKDQVPLPGSPSSALAQVKKETPADSSEGSINRIGGN